MSRREIGEHFRGVILAKLGRNGPKKKVEAFVKLLAPPPAEAVLNDLYEAIDTRNTFVHPTRDDRGSPPRVGWNARRQKDPPTIDDEWFDRSCVAFREFANWLHHSVRSRCSEWIAANAWQFKDLLSDAQRATFSLDYHRYTARNPPPLTSLLGRVEERVADGNPHWPPPKVILLNLNEGVEENAEALGAFCTAHPEIPVVLCELRSTGRLQLGEELAANHAQVELVPNRRTVEGSPYQDNPTYDPGKVLQKILKKRLGV